MLFKFSYSLQDFDGLLILPTSPIEIYFIRKGVRLLMSHINIYFFFTIYFSSTMIFFFWVVITQKKNNKNLVPLT